MVWDAFDPMDPDVERLAYVNCIDCLPYMDAFDGEKSVLIYWFPRGSKDNTSNMALAWTEANYELFESGKKDFSAKEVVMDITSSACV
jgi:hypothetical protein